ncbi:MAG TPA: hypothetical protein VJY33_13400, partial [Isosphaeraceae bacterium]|nr:hypothetical protein [Isosphaeraceae bacterium]
MRTRSFILVANLGLLLPCCHSWGDEPESLTDMQLRPLPQELSRKGDESVRRVQASATPSPGAGQPGTAAPRPAPSPGQTPPPRTTPTPPSPSPPAIPLAPITPALPSTADTTLSQPALAAATVAAADMGQAGGFG